MGRSPTTTVSPSPHSGTSNTLSITCYSIQGLSHRLTTRGHVKSVPRHSVTQSIDMLLDTIFEDPYEGLHAADDMHRPPDRPHNFLFKHTCNQAHVGAPLPPITVLVLLPWAFSRLGVVLAAGTVIVTVLVSHAANMMLHARRAHTSRMGWNTRRSKAMLHWTVALFGCAAAALCTLCAVDILIGMRVHVVCFG